MADASVFLRKRKDKLRGAARQTSGQVRPVPPRPPPTASSSRIAPLSTSNGITTVKNEPIEDRKPNPNITEIKLFSSNPASGLRFNMMKMNHGRDVDPIQISRPIMLNRKHPGPKQYPTYAIDDDNKIVGKYIYDDKGEPVLGADGHPTIEIKDAGVDPELVGGAPAGQKRKIKKGLKEVFHQDKEVIRLRREEATPWILESGRPKEKHTIPEYWVGRMTEPTALPTVLLINDGSFESGFSVIPLGRTYKFEPERPFKVLDVEAAHKLFEHQAKHKIHDRWSQRPDGPSTSGPSTNGDIKPKVEALHTLKQEERAWRLEQRMKGTLAQVPKVKVERFEDDMKREGRQVQRGLEGGEDEELDYDFNEDFQDDDDVNTFYRNEDEEEDAKLQEARIKKEQRMANANVGDRPQIQNDSDDDDDLFGETKLNAEGRRLKRMMRERGLQNVSDSSESESDSASTVTVKEEKDDKPLDKDKDTPKSAPGSAERPSRPPSRGPGNRTNTASPSGGRRLNLPSAAKTSAALPGAGFASVAHRATRDDSPRRSRANSPSSRAQSPENSSGRAMSPPSRGGSPARALSPGPGGSSSSGRAGSIGPSSNREANPSIASMPKPGVGVKRKPTQSPNPTSGSNPTSSSSVAPSPKRKPSPTGSTSSEHRSKKKKSSTPDDLSQTYEGLVTPQAILDYLRSHDTPKGVPMGELIRDFKRRILDAGENWNTSSKVLTTLVHQFSKSEKSFFLLKPEYREKN